MKSVLITPAGIQKNLKNIKPLDAICEYIWNGFDANATMIEVKLIENDFGILNQIVISDNGTGINYEELKNKFQPFNDSKKSSSLQKSNHSLPHGQKGIGRLTFFSFSQSARWDTIYRENNKNYEYYIFMNKNSLNQYDDNNEKQPVIVDKKTGTSVTFDQVESLDKKDIIEKIKEEFFWFLELNKDNNFTIKVNEEKIDYSDYIKQKKCIDITGFNCNEQYDIQFVQWNKKMGNEFSKIYYIGSDNIERFKETTKLNKKSDQFFHSIYIKSNYFNDFHFTNEIDDDQSNLFPSKSDDEYKNLMNAINKFLTSYRYDFLKKTSSAYIEKLVEEKLYPEFDSNIIGNYQKKELDNLVKTLYSAQPKIFTGLSNDNKKITLQLLKLIMDNGDKPELFAVLKGIIDLEEEELAELSNILKYTSLNNITKTIKLLCDRQKVIQVLKEILFNKEFNSYEVKHVQEIVENHYWLFGEQYNLITAAEPDFESALKGLIKVQTGIDERVDINPPDKNKEMDIYMLRQDRHGNVTENVVVELKRPKIKLGEKEVSQVKRYMRVIKSEPRFNAGNIKWTFYLMGNEFDNSGYIEGELESHRNLGDQHLIHEQDNGMTKIYVLKWSELFDSYSKKHDFLMEKLKLQEKLWLEKHDSADNAIESIKDSSAKLQNALIPKNNK